MKVLKVKQETSGIGILDRRSKMKFRKSDCLWLVSRVKELELSNKELRQRRNILLEMRNSTAQEISRDREKFLERECNRISGILYKRAYE